MTVKLGKGVILKLWFLLSHVKANKFWHWQTALAAPRLFYHHTGPPKNRSLYWQWHPHPQYQCKSNCTHHRNHPYYVIRLWAMGGEKGAIVETSQNEMKSKGRNSSPALALPSNKQRQTKVNAALCGTTAQTANDWEKLDTLIIKCWSNRDCMISKGSKNSLRILCGKTTSFCPVPTHL